MFGFSIIKTKKLNQLYDMSTEIVTANQCLRAQNDRLVKYCHTMAGKLKNHGLKLPDWWFQGL